MRKIIFSFLIFFLICIAAKAANLGQNPDVTNISTLRASSDFSQANQAFEKKNYSTALSFYQTALSKHTPQELPTPDQTPSVTNKILILFSTNSVSSSIKPHFGNMANGYLCFKMGQCYLQEKKINAAVTTFNMGVSMGGDTEMGNECLYEKGFCQMKQKDYQGAYQSMKEYVRRNVDRDKKDIDPQRMRSASFIGMVSAWRLNKSGTVFESDMTGAMVLAVKIKSLMPNLDNRIYFKNKIRMMK